MVALSEAEGSPARDLVAGSGPHHHAGYRGPLGGRTPALRRAAVEQQRKRVERELAFQKAYDAAWQRLYPDESRVNFFALGRSPSAQSLLSTDTAGPSRYNVVVALEDCSRCDTEVQRLLDQGALMDIWVVDSDGDDDAIRQWATEVGIPADRVRQGQVTLNHGGQLSVSEDALPRIMPRG
nr:hypothetical protein [Halomonas elongata]